jgi:hypothetical protein
MGQKHPNFVPKVFFEKYRYWRTISDVVYGDLYEFLNPSDLHHVYLQVINMPPNVGKIDISQVKQVYDFHHPNLLHIFNFFRTRGSDLKYHLGKTSEQDSRITKLFTA